MMVTWRNRIWSAKPLIINIAVSLLSICIALALIEGYFRVFFDQSDGFGITLASRNWFKKYWQPINSLNYRDYEWTENELADKSVVAVVGDSFVAGHGTADISDRFQGVLAHKLGSDYAVVTIARNGAETVDEISYFKNYPYKDKVDIIIWSYFPNDIRGTAKKLGRQWTPPGNRHPPARLKFFVDNSYAFNFFYWRFLGRMEKWMDSSLAWLKNQYEDPVVWNAHQVELEEVYRLAQTNNAELIVVLFPNLLIVEESHEYAIAKVKRVFDDLGVPILDVADLIQGEKTENLIASNLDPHPSVYLHQLVGESLYPMVLDSSRKLKKQAHTASMLEHYWQLMTTYSSKGQRQEALDAYHHLLDMKPEVAQGQNLVSNPGFEEGVWHTYQTSETATFTLDTTISYSGQYSALIEGLAQGQHGLWYQSLPLEQATYYHYSAWVKTEDMGELDVQLLQWADETLKVIEGSNENINNLTSDWTYVETIFAWPADVSPIIHLAPVIVHNQGKVWIDDVKLVKLSF